MNDRIDKFSTRATSMVCGAEVREALIAAKLLRPFSARRKYDGPKLEIDDLGLGAVAAEIFAALGAEQAAEIAADPKTDPRIAAALSALLALDRSTRDAMIFRARRRISWAPPAEDPGVAIAEFLRRKD